MNRLIIGGLSAIVIFIIALFIGGVMASAAVFAFIKFGALVAVIESVRPLRWLAYKLGAAFDVALVILSFIIMFTAGVTIGISFTITSLMWTILYRPYIKYRQNLAKIQEYEDNFRLH